MKNILKKNWIWIFIIVILLSGGYFAFNNNEGMSLERLCFVRKSDGVKICVKGDTSCTYFPDGSSKCTQANRKCNQFTTCASCVDKDTKPVGAKCFWNNNERKCGSKLENGYSDSCKNINNGRMNNGRMNNGRMNNGNKNSYVPVISFLPTTSLLNAAPANYYAN
jgi:hypothetical protein